MHQSPEAARAPDPIFFKLFEIFSKLGLEPALVGTILHAVLNTLNNGFRMPGLDYHAGMEDADFAFSFSIVIFLTLAQRGLSKDKKNKALKTIFSLFSGLALLGISESLATTWQLWGPIFCAGGPSGFGLVVSFIGWMQHSNEYSEEMT